MKRGSDRLFFVYDVGQLVGFDHITSQGTDTYYYRYNGKGEIVALTNASGNVVANYSYDAWGADLGVTDASGNAITSGSHIAQLNPFRYKSYCYDTETDLYYLNSRYYDPIACRFISMDNQLRPNNMVGMNLFAYCGNNPVMRIDTNGRFWQSVWDWAKTTYTAVKNMMSDFVESVKREVTKEHFAERKEKNGVHPTYEEVNNDDNWTQVPQTQTKFHDNGVGNPEKKYTHVDGREAVFDGDTLAPIKAPEYVATYNYYPIQQLPQNPTFYDYVVFAQTTYLHARYDVLPYYICGNSFDDSSMIWDRIIITFS